MTDTGGLASRRPGARLCVIPLGLAAVLAPLLVLFGLKYGLVTSMLTALAEDPQKRELKPLGYLSLLMEVLFI